MGSSPRQCILSGEASVLSQGVKGLAQAVREEQAVAAGAEFGSHSARRRFGVLWMRGMAWKGPHAGLRAGLYLASKEGRVSPGSFPIRDHKVILFISLSYSLCQ